MQIQNKISLAIAGIVPLTTIDYPDHLAAVVFCQGCPLRCHYCHNPHLQPATNSLTTKTWEDLEKFLLKRVNLLEAIVFSGGEPTLQKDLVAIVKKVKSLGFKVGLHTAGIYPRKLEKLLPFIDWVGMDIKAPFVDYEKITMIKKSGEQALASTKLLLTSKVAYEFRTTFHPDLLSAEQVLTIANTLSAMGVNIANNYKIQLFRSDGCINPELKNINSLVIENIYQDLCFQLGLIK